jgi:hypothetical protein
MATIQPSFANAAKFFNSLLGVSGLLDADASNKPAYKFVLNVETYCYGECRRRVTCCTSSPVRLSISSSLSRITICYSDHVIAAVASTAAGATYKDASGTTGCSV